MVKKSTHIQLVLITAALASCSRVIIPNESLGACPTDSTLIDRPVYQEYAGTYDETPFLGIPYTPLWMAPVGHIYLGPIGPHYHYPGNQYRGVEGLKNNTMVVRGGFGSSAAITSVAS